MIGKIVCKHYELTEIIDFGSYGTVYKAKREKPLLTNNNYE